MIQSVPQNIVMDLNSFMRVQSYRKIIQYNSSMLYLWIRAWSSFDDTLSFGHLGVAQTHKSLSMYINTKISNYLMWFVSICKYFGESSHM